MRAKSLFFVALFTQVAATRVAVENLNFGYEEADLEQVVAEAKDSVSLAEIGESTETTSRRRMPPAPAPDSSRRRGVAPAPVPSYDARRRGGQPPAPVPSPDTRRRGTPVPSSGTRRRGAPVPSSGARRRAGQPPAPVPSDRRRRMAPALESRRRAADIRRRDFRRRDSSRRRLNYNDVAEDTTRRRSDLRRRATTGWIEGSHRRRSVYPTAGELSTLGFAAGIAIGYSVSSADNHQYYYHNVGWYDSFGVYHAPGYYSPDGYYWASGDDIGFSTKYGAWSQISPELRQLFSLLDLNADGLLNQEEFRIGLSRELIEFGPAGNVLVPR